MVLILDTSALFAMEDLPQEDSLVPPGVIDELKKYKDGRLERWGEFLRVSECTTASVDRVKETAKKSGDLGRLSDVDITVIALALDMNGSIMTDDFSIQNVSKIIGIPYIPVGTEGIKKIEKWNYQCIGCRKWYKEKMTECPICGSSMKACRKK